ncbi:MAG: hypothetical protein ACM3JG_11045 [Thiohalocapsa sp.]
MLRGRSLGRVVTFALLGGLAMPALPARADGLSRFEAAVKKADPGTLTYKNAKSLGDNGFLIEDVVLTPPPEKTGAKTEPVAIKRVTIEDFDFAAVDKGRPPNFLKLRAEGIAIADKPVEGVDLAQMAGIDKLSADFQLDYRLDPERKTLNVNRVELDLAGLARIEVSFVLDGVSVDELAKPDAAMNDATVRTATLAFEDRSLLAKVLPAAAKLQSTDADGLVKIGTEALNGMRAGQGPQALAAIDALVSYMTDYKGPKGPLKITLNPPAKLSAAAVSNAKTPDEAIKAMGLVVSYAGTRPGPTPMSAIAAGGAVACKPGSRLFALHEEAYWSVTVRDATKSGDKCVARIDGGNDDDIVFPLAEALAWSIDGPSKPVSGCMSGAQVLVSYKDGGWYPSKVTAKPAAAGKCPVKYNSDESEEVVELKRVRQLD